MVLSNGVFGSGAVGLGGVEGEEHLLGFIRAASKRAAVGVDGEQLVREGDGFDDRRVVDEERQRCALQDGKVKHDEVLGLGTRAGVPVVVERIGDAFRCGLEREQWALAMLLRVERIIGGFNLRVDRVCQMPERLRDGLIDLMFELFAFLLEFLVVVEGTDLLFESVDPGLQLGGLVVDLIIELHGFSERQDLGFQVVDGDLQLGCLRLVVALLLAELVFEDTGELVVVVLDGF